MESYWSRLTQARLSRRRAIGGMAAAGAGAALLAACGSGGWSKSGSGEASLLAAKVDTTKQAVASGS
jgi:hypothetical protein